MAESTWAVVQHVAWEGPGLIGQALRARGTQVRIYRMDVDGGGESLPEAGSLGGLVVMGGPMGVYEAERYPHLPREQALMAHMARAGRPVLGVCLGAQLLAAALGAEVSKGPVFEVGAGEVRLTEEGERDAVLGGGGGALPVVHWHQDTFTLPAGAVRLAGSKLYPQQAFRWGRAAYGLQFHAEVDEALAEAWRPRLPAGVDLDAEAVKRIGARGREVAARFLRLAEG